jgi:membrane protease YdiL (CAAX protease family)
MGWKPGKGRYLLVSYFLPLVYVFAAYLLVWLTGFGKFDPDALYKFVSEANGPSFTPFGIVGTYLAYMLSLGFILNCIAALGEEIGWRGLLVPELAKKTTFTSTALISGGIWASYHWPLILSGQYGGEGRQWWFALICFTIMIISNSFPYAWLRLKSGSMWGAVIMHAAHNLFIQAIFNQLTTDTGLTKYAIDEFGVSMALVSVGVAYLFWRKRHEVETKEVDELQNALEPLPAG